MVFRAYNSYLVNLKMLSSPYNAIPSITIPLSIHSHLSRAIPWALSISFVLVTIIAWKLWVLKNLVTAPCWSLCLLNFWAVVKWCECVEWNIVLGSWHLCPGTVTDSGVVTTYKLYHVKAMSSYLTCMSLHSVAMHSYPSLVPCFDSGFWCLFLPQYC